MWTEVRNNSRSQLDEAQDHNITQIISPAFSWLPSSSERNGSITASPPALDESRVHSTSGIIPGSNRLPCHHRDFPPSPPNSPLRKHGAIAAAVFIGFLLALYAVLWKCMVTQPKRRKRRRSKIREQRSLKC